MRDESIVRVRRTVDSEVGEVLPDGSTRTVPSGGTDWSALESMTEEEIEANALSDPDNPPLTRDELARMRPIPNPRAIRQRLRMTQEQFATRFQLRLGTVRDWEQGKKEPDSAARALLRVIEHDPEAVLHALDPSR